VLKGNVDGVEAAETITARFDIPVIYLTAYSDDETLQRAKVTGPFGYVLKPFEERELHCVIELALQKHRLENAIKDSERHFRSLIENASDLIMIVDGDYGIRYAGPSHKRIVGFTPNELVGKNLLWFVHQGDAPAVVAALAQVVRINVVETADFRFRCKDGSWRTLEAISSNRLDDPAVAGIVINARDVTKRVRAEEALREAHRTLERRVERRTAELEATNAALKEEIVEREKLEKEVAEISHKEQQRIGQELHDGLGQELTGLGYLAETLFCDLQARGVPEAQTADKLASGVQHALDQTRTIANDLVSVELGANGLVSALQRLVANTQQRCGIPCQFHCSHPVPVEDAGVASQLFRIAQEAVNNAAKHAQAEHIAVKLGRKDRRITIQVHDDGVSIPGDLKQTGGMGLRIMQYRAAVIGATLDIRPGDGGGTLVTCTLDQNDPDDHEHLHRNQNEQVQDPDRG